MSLSFNATVLLTITVNLVVLVLAIVHTQPGAIRSTQVLTRFAFSFSLQFTASSTLCLVTITVVILVILVIHGHIGVDFFFVVLVFAPFSASVSASLSLFTMSFAPNQCSLFHVSFAFSVPLPFVI